MEQSPADEAISDPQQVKAVLDRLRKDVLQLLFGRDRPSAKAAQSQVEAFCQQLDLAAKLANWSPEQETEFAATARERHRDAVSSEKSILQACRDAVAEHAAIHARFYAELDVLVDQFQRELDQLSEDEDAFQRAPEELQTALANYKKGIQIIVRMLSRAKDRKKELVAQIPAAIVEEMQIAGPPADASAFGDYLLQISHAFHQAREENFHATQDAKAHCEQCQKACTEAVKQVISAVDGVEGGKQSEPRTRSRLEQEHADHKDLVDAWVHKYERLLSRLDEFFGKTGIQTHTVERGEKFDPETMDPEGTVEDPELEDEVVHSVSRRGFSLGGMTIRPIVVEVVKNN
jgi:molecular chaperone GrpE (heat shock protein)